MAVSNTIPEPTCCETCGFDDAELFGYCDRDSGWHWFCAAHRPGRWYADARRWPQKGEDGYDEEPI